MSILQNEVYCQNMRENVIEALEEKEYQRAKDLVDELKFNNSCEILMTDIWDEISSKQRQAYLSWFDENYPTFKKLIVKHL